MNPIAIKKEKIFLRHACIEEKQKIFQWLCCSDTTELHLGGINFPECPVPTWEEFLAEFQDYYFLEEDRDKASIMIIENNNVEIGCVVYKLFYLKKGCAELSIWLNNKKFTGQGFGPKSIEKVVEYLYKKYCITKFLLRPSIKNVVAIKAYKKCGFREAEDKENVLKDFIKEEYYNEYYNGEYGLSNSVIMILEII